RPPLTFDTVCPMTFGLASIGMATAVERRPSGIHATPRGEPPMEAIRMTKTLLKPLALAVSAALALTACGKQEPADTPAAPAGSASVAHAATAAAPSVFDISELGPATEACTDFNQFVNAKWIAANPIPADQTVWGSFN